MLGILADHHFDWPLELWVALCFALLLAWLGLRLLPRVKRHAWPGSLLLLLGTSCIFGGWHHYRWNCFHIDGIARYASTDFKPVRVRGTIQAVPQILPAESPSPFKPVAVGERTELLLEAFAIHDGIGWRSCRGPARVLVDGVAAELVTGQSIELQGHLARTGATRNPGEFDFSSHQRRARQQAFVFVEFPEAIFTLDAGLGQPTIPAGQLSILSKARAYCFSLARDQFQGSQGAIAQAILLGNRRQLSASQNQAFMASGTIHLLAISGLHVGILAGGLFWLGKLGLLGRRSVCVGMIIIVASYAMLVEGRPPVLRAAILVILFSAARLLGRNGLSLNTLAAAGLVVLALNPAELFNCGAQLSFLAVGMLCVFGPWLAGHTRTSAMDRLIASSSSWGQRIYSKIARWISLAVRVSVVIWLFALPLVACKFHLVSLAGPLVTPLLLVPLAFALWSGFLMLLHGWVAPPISAWCAAACERCLWLVEELVFFTHSFPGTHFWTVGPEPVSVAFFYVALLVAIVLRWNPWRLVTILAVWMVFGWMVPAGWSMADGISPAGSGKFHCTMIDVGHGTCVLVQTPGGQNLLYDCGSYGNPECGRLSIVPALWQAGVHRLDAVILSHADLDHYNCLPEVLERIQVDQVVTAPGMWDAQVAPLVELRRLIQDHGAKLVEVAQGDQLSLRDPTTKCRFLGPPAAHADNLLSEGESDNSRSLVLVIEVFGHRLLFPGDLEGPGLERILAMPRLDCTMIMAPHHGSEHSLPGQFLKWSTPEFVLISADGFKADGSAYTAGAAQADDLRVVYRTFVDGAIRFEITPASCSQSAAGNPPAGSVRCFGWLANPDRF